MAMSPQATVFAIQAVMRLGNAARRAYQDKVLDTSITLPNVDVARITAPARALQVVEAAFQRGELVRSDWIADCDLVAADDNSSAGLTAQNRILAAAARVDPEFARASEQDALVVLEQWSDDANRHTPLGRIGLELADIALDYVGASPALFGVDGNGAKLITSVAVSLAELLPNPDDPRAKGSTFAAGAIRVFVEAGLRALDHHVDKRVDEAHLRDFAHSTLKPLIDAVIAGDQGRQPWYDLRDELLGPVAEAAIDSLARNQAAFLGGDFDVGTKAGALTNSVLLAVKNNGLADDLGKDGLVRVYGAMLDIVIARPGAFFGAAAGNTDLFTQKLLVNAARKLKQSSPPFDKSLGSSLLASTYEVIGANAALLAGSVDAGDWTEALSEIGETLIREIADGLATGVRTGTDPRVLQRVFTRQQGEKLLRIIVEEVAAAPGLVVNNEAPEVRALVAIVAGAIAKQSTVLLKAEDWLVVAADLAREVAANPGRLISTSLSLADEQLLFKLLSGMLNASSSAAADGRRGGSVLFGSTLVEAIRTLLEAAAGNAQKALDHVGRIETLVTGLASFAKSHKTQVGREEWLVLFRHYIARVIDTGELPSFDSTELLTLLTEA